MTSKILTLAILITGLFITSGCGDKAPAESTDKTKDTETSPPPRGSADKITDLTRETPENMEERRDIMSAVEKDLKSKGITHVRIEATFFKQKGDYAFFEGTVKNADGSDYKVENEHMDCCHVEALLQAAASQWTVLESEAFATDLWSACLYKKYNLPRELFSVTVEECQ